MTPAEAASLAGRYTKQYGAGAFAFPTRKELEADPSQLRTWDGGFVAVAKTLTRDSGRKDFTGTPFTLESGKVVYTHIARDPGSYVPNLADEADYIITYLDDRELCAHLVTQGFTMLAATVSASSELKGVFHQGPAHKYPAHELATATPVDVPLDMDTFAGMYEEIHDLDGYRDDWPLYSDGTWGALCLKGFYPDDPGRDMKPSEMNKKWHAEHPGELERTCEWTSLAADLPEIMGWITSIPEWQTGMERVRLLRMSGNGGKGGALGRHTDIADKSMGTADGQIVRFHVPLVTDPAIELHSWGLDGLKRSTHLRAGGVYYLDARKPHAVTNPTGVDRVHLVVDVISSPAVRQQIADGYLVAGQ